MFPSRFILSILQLGSSDLIGWNRLGNNVARHVNARRNIRCNKTFGMVFDQNVIDGAAVGVALAAARNARKPFRRHRRRIC